jgi:predicted Zn finger-like uncharacterized protein
LIVECPRCRARYRVETGVLEREQTFKCSRCSHIFAYEPATASPEPSEPARTAPPPSSEPRRPEPPRGEPRKLAERDVDSLSFSFSRPSATTSEETAAEAEPPSLAPPQGPPQGAPADHDFSFVEDSEQGDSSDAIDEELDAGPAEHDLRSDEPRFVRGEEELRVEEENGRDPGRPYLLYLTILVILYAILALDLLNHPAQAAKLLASVPIVGNMLGEDHLLQTRVQLQDVEGAYQQIKDEHLVFIVSGRAVNAAAESLKGVQIESAVYDQNGKLVETKSIYCGNAMSLKIVKDLSTKEITLLQRLEPPKRFEIRPGEAAGFSVVFLNPPPALKEFTARVAAAQSSAS